MQILGIDYRDKQGHTTHFTQGGKVLSARDFQ